MLTGMILIDLQKAFDTIDHDICFSKMAHLGFSQATISWYKSYLINGGDGRVVKKNGNANF